MSRQNGKAKAEERPLPELQKAPTGVTGLDQLTGGGLPRGRTTLVCGGPGCGKTMLATAFLVHGAVDHDEAGVIISFDERAEDLVVNSQSLGYDLEDLIARDRLAIDFIHLDRNDMEESGTFDLEGLFVRIDLAVRTVGAKRVVLDSIDSLFSGLPNEAIVRSELRRLFGWLKEHGLTTMLTAERGDKSFSRHGIEEYVSDCVILLDHRIENEISTRRLRVVKYRGSHHGTNEYPFLIGESGISVLPVTSIGLSHAASEERIPSGIEGLDTLLEGKGYFKGSSILVSGGPGSGKTSIAAQFLDAACAQGARCLHFSFEESPPQLLRNMRSVGIDLQPWLDKGLLHCLAVRPTEYGLETHLAMMHAEIADNTPSVVVVDPISALLDSGGNSQAHVMVLRLVDFLKSEGATAIYTNLQAQSALLHTELDISSLMDTWLLLQVRGEAGPESRSLQIVKSRGMAHPLRPHDLAITPGGLTVTPGVSGQ